VFDKWLPTFGKVKCPQLFIPVEKMYTWWHYLGCSDCLDVFITTEKNPKDVTKYSIKRKMAKT